MCIYTYVCVCVSVCDLPSHEQCLLSALATVSSSKGSFMQFLLLFLCTKGNIKHLPNKTNFYSFWGRPKRRKHTKYASKILLKWMKKCFYLLCMYRLVSNMHFNILQGELDLLLFGVIVSHSENYWKPKKYIADYPASSCKLLAKRERVNISIMPLNNWKIWVVTKGAKKFAFRHT